MSLSLDDDVSVIKGVGEKTAASLLKFGIRTVRDLLYTLPRTYENYQTATCLKNIRPGRIVVRGKISDLKVKYTRRKNFSVTEGVIYDDTDAIRVVWFNQPYRAKQFEMDKEYVFIGNFEFNKGHYQLSSPSARLAEDIDKDTEASFRPVYRSKGLFKSDNFVKIFQTIRSDFAFIPDLLPMEGAPDFVKPGVRADALFCAHFAENEKDVSESRNYLAYEELFELILAATLNKNANKKLSSVPLPFNQKKIKDLIAKLPFSLTGAQRRATWEILQDLGKPTPMNRLLQGDVGSGKTIVAAIAAYQAVISGHQVALLAPTAILATQHVEGFRELLEPLGVHICLLIGSTKNKSGLKSQIKNGEYDIVIGTHALITDDTEFKSLALCIIDEQHRFGVNQRQKLLTKTPSVGISPHLLSMSATPIPRSLQLSIFGDLDVSILNELPKGRQPIETKILSNIAMTDTLYPEVRDFLARGQQVYWICRSIEGKNDTSTSVKKMAEYLKPIFPHAHIAFLHGHMNAAEKDQIMTEFSDGKIDILVSTTVVEVGVNVPNANLMVIMDAENYGLAQIHQLRGRVGRGHDSAKCFLVIDGDSTPTPRLRELEHSTDGFHLAEVDLRLRGPGEIYGSLQHGALNLNIATLADTRLIALASRHAKIFAEKLEGENPESDIFETEEAENPKTSKNMLQYKELNQLIKKYQQLTTLN